MALSLSSSPVVSVPPELAWEPLPPSEWNAEAARHLLRRAGWTALPAEVGRAAQDGLDATLDRLFPASPILLPMPELTARLEEELPDFQRAIAHAATPEQKRALERELREESRAALLELTIEWLRFAARPENSAFEKWVLFLSDVYVVAFEKVGRTPLIYRHFDLIARHALGPAPILTKAVSRSPAMVVYLDLNRSRRGAPNENFARELFELFVLGEGHYTERDIKEAARAFTGYRILPPDTVVFARREHDDGRKAIFGRIGNFDGDDVIDLAYELDAAGAFLPHEWVKFYLSDTMLPADYLAAIGRSWRAVGYDLRWLARRLFGSRIFFAPEFRGEFIKSPVQLYLGLVQDFGLGVIPAPRYLVNPMRRMGQTLFDPPNVRGWVGGRNWINSASFEARRTLVELLFFPPNDRALNAEEKMAIAAARAGGEADFAVSDARLAAFCPPRPADAVRRLTNELLAVDPGPVFRRDLGDYLAARPEAPPGRFRRLRQATIAVLQSPEYQLC